MANQEDFYQNVYEVVKLIPFGRVTSYGAIANYLGAKRSSRVVGWALNSSHKNSIAIPAHRVVNRLGLLSGKHHFQTPNLMEERLLSEGHVIVNDQIQNFDAVFWDPASALSL
ncbi:MGMT family protein [Crocinitomix algicola]|uniref:MGMT family protein n=1 Tax=Crocinitomix algicola TaxID=1740263 RepID=UPI000872EC2B|nr:MGMT family protein [Crocinitomix algicola]